MGDRISARPEEASSARPFFCRARRVCKMVGASLRESSFVERVARGGRVAGIGPRVTFARVGGGSASTCSGRRRVQRRRWDPHQHRRGRS